MKMSNPSARQFYSAGGTFKAFVGFRSVTLPNTVEIHPKDGVLL